MSSVVLDASSVLALLQQEAGAADVRAAILAGAAISAVNVSEVVAKPADGGLDERAIREIIGSLAVVIVPL